MLIASGRAVLFTAQYMPQFYNPVKSPPAWGGKIACTCWISPAICERLAGHFTLILRSHKGHGKAHHEERRTNRARLIEKFYKNKGFPDQRIELYRWETPAKIFENWKFFCGLSCQSDVGALISGLRLPEWLNEETYRAKIQPALTGITIPAIATALGASEPYATDIRAGRRRPASTTLVRTGANGGVLGTIRRGHIPVTPFIRT
jgi:hypothetical protein